MQRDFPHIAPTRAPIETREQMELFAAISTGCTQSVSGLLARGVPVNSGDDDDDTPLTLAISRSDQPMVELLLSAGADVNLTGLGGKSPLRMAIEVAAPIDIIRVLLAAGADPLATSYDDTDKKDISDMMAADRNYIGKRTGDENGYTILYEVVRAANAFLVIEAVKDGNPQKLQTLLAENKNIDVNIYNHKGETALLHACQMGRTDLAEMLWYAGANPAQPHKYDPKVTPFSMAQLSENAHTWRAVERYVEWAEEDFRRKATQLTDDMPVMKTVTIKPRNPRSE